MLEDSLRSIRNYYFNLPQWCKNAVGFSYNMLPSNVKLGKTYRDFKLLLSRSRSWSRQEIMDYQFRQLQETLCEAYEHVPYYRKTFNEYGVSPDSIKSLEDVKLLPTLTKKDIKNNFHDLVSRGVNPRKHLHTTTGGSTAEPIRFLQEKGLTRSKERAFIWDGWSRVGYLPGAKTVQLKGRTVGSPEKNVFWEYEPIQNFLEMDSNYLKEENIPLYLEAINKFHPEFMIGYPSSIYLIAKYLKENSLSFPDIRAVFLASENVYPWQREMLRDVFHCRIFSHYGHSEMVLLGMECEHSHNLHFYPEYGLLEVLDAEGNPVEREGAHGELVGTSFHNFVMPLIRYKTQDIGVIGPSTCECGRSYPLISDVEGRLQEFIVTADNRLISICVMGAAHFDVLDHVYETQYYQDTPGKVVFKVVPKSGYNEGHRKLILKSLTEKIGGKVKAEVIEVDSIHRTKSGKHLMIEQKIPLKILEGSQDLVLKDK